MYLVMAISNWKFSQSINVIYDCSDLIGQTLNTINHFLIQSTHITFASFTYQQIFLCKTKQIFRKSKWIFIYIQRKHSTRKYMQQAKENWIILTCNELAMSGIFFYSNLFHFSYGRKDYFLAIPLFTFWGKSVNLWRIFKGQKFLNTKFWLSLLSSRIIWALLNLG